MKSKSKTEVPSYTEVRTISKKVISDCVKGDREVTLVNIIESLFRLGFMKPKDDT